MELREENIRLWFDMWLQKKDMGIDRLFSPDAVYIESWGPEYHGRGKIRHWFQEWNRRGSVLVWDIKQFFHQGEQTAVEWYFKNSVDGRTEEFDGVSLIRWDQEGKIVFLQEFGCNLGRYDPYADGPEPKFRTTGAAWF